jgi:hypothetical protein
MIRLALVCSLSLFIGCPAPSHDGNPSDDDDAVGDDDDAVGDDDDVVGDDDDAVGDDDDAVGDDDDATIPESTDGNVSLTLYRMPDGQGGVMEGGSFGAMFFEELVAPTGGVVYDMPAGPEDCAVTTYTYNDLMSGTQGQYDYLSAGPLTVEGPGGSFTVQPTTGGGVVSYSELLQLGSDLVPGATYEIDAAGADLSAFHATIEMPADLNVTSPSIAQTFHANGALDVQWSGGENASVWISVSTVAGQNYGYAYCEVTNDGSFTVPANVMGQLPAGDATLTVTQPLWDYVEVDGLWIYLFGAVYVSVTGVVS